jgi:hypothetical protein
LKLSSNARTPALQQLGNDTFSWAARLYRRSDLYCNSCCL